MDDELKHIIISLKQGDKTAFDKLFHLFHHKIYLFCRHYHLTKEEAEEIVQEVYLKMWLNRGNLNVSHNIQSFIYTIAKNMIFNHFKRKIYQKAAYEYHLNHQDPYQMEQEIICNDLELIMEKAIGKLPQKRRIIFNLSRKEGLSNKEIAKKLDISLKTVESQMRLSLQYLRQVLKNNSDIVPAIVWILCFYINY
jgi:RNA polymerase sigma-70 factor (family 1)